MSDQEKEQRASEARPGEPWILTAARLGEPGRKAREQRPNDATAPDEDWRAIWDDGAECMRCHTSLLWEGDMPETVDDAICHDCAWKELEALRAEKAQRLDKATSVCPSCGEENYVPGEMCGVGGTHPEKRTDYPTAVIEAARALLNAEYGEDRRRPGRLVREDGRRDGVDEAERLRDALLAFDHRPDSAMAVSHASSHAAGKLDTRKDPK